MRPLGPSRSASRWRKRTFERTASGVVIIDLERLLSYVDSPPPRGPRAGRRLIGPKRRPIWRRLGVSGRPMGVTTDSGELPRIREKLRALGKATHAFAAATDDYG